MGNECYSLSLLCMPYGMKPQRLSCLLGFPVLCIPSHCQAISCPFSGVLCNEGKIICDFCKFVLDNESVAML